MSNDTTASLIAQIRGVLDGLERSEPMTADADNIKTGPVSHKPVSFDSPTADYEQAETLARAIATERGCREFTSLRRAGTAHRRSPGGAWETVQRWEFLVPVPSRTNH